MNKEEWKKELETKAIEEITGQKFNVLNDWGSCQYASALAFYKLYFMMKNDLTFSETLSLLGFHISYGEFLPLRNVQLKIIDEKLKQISLNVTRQDLKSIKYDADTISMIANAKNFEGIFGALRDSTWDLWTAVPYVAEKIITRLKIEEIENHPVYGPKWDDFKNTANYKTGFCCALLVDFNIINDDSCFVEFNT